MSCHHVGARIFNAFKCDNRMQENGWLGDICFFQIVFCPLKHDIRYTESQDFIRLLHQLFGKCTGIIKLFSHSRKLRTLAGKDISMLHRKKFRLKLVEMNTKTVNQVINSGKAEYLKTCINEIN